MNCNCITIANLLDLTKTDAASLFEGHTYPFEVLPLIKEYITETLIPSLDSEQFDNRGDNVWIHKTAKVAPTAYIGGPCVIFAKAEIRHCAYIRGSAIVGKGCVVGNSTELKNCVLFDSVQVPHYNYVGDSVFGYKAHTGAGVITANVKADKSNVCVKIDGKAIETGVRKFGAILGDFADIGCNSVMTPGAIIGRNTNVYPLSRVRGCVPANSIFKAPDNIVKKIVK